MTVLFKLVAMLLACVPPQETLGEYWGTAEAESKYYPMVDVPLPNELAIEAGSFEIMPDGKLAVSTRRGDIFLVDGAFDEHPEPKFEKFASGLDEVFGMAYRDGAFYVTQQTEVTRIADTDGDGRADEFKTLSDRWGFRNYHEFSFGSKPDKNGNIWVALCLSESYSSKVPFRGWCLKVTPDGKTIPVCSGIRSPCGIGPNEHGVMFYAESQGPWNGSCSLKVLEPGGFMGHPISFNWYPLAPELGPAPPEPNTPSRLEIERQRVPQLVPYAVVFPYIRMGRSISGFMVDRTGGKFGPFENQIFIGDFSLGVVMRATTEKVNGVWQGACYPFREGFDTGLLALTFTPEGQLIAGGTNRGWPVRGRRDYAIQRLDWTGIVPFEIRQINARHDGFRIHFTKPVDADIASDPNTYQLKTFTHIYRQGYGSPEVDQTIPAVTRATVAEDGRSVDIVVDGLVKGHVHDFFLPNMKSREGENLLHTSAYYTLNEIPSDDASPAVPPSHSTRLPLVTHRPPGARQLIGPESSQMIPESDRPSGWTFENGVLTAPDGWDSVMTPRGYRDFRMHVEFSTNDAPEKKRGANGNSGVYLQRRYEIQILNSANIAPEDYHLDDCGCIYRYKKPDAFVCKPPGEWQSYDIVFRAARFLAGEKIENARVTVWHNGTLIHDDVELTRKTGAGKPEGPEPLPILLQGHHNQVRFRNFWVEDLLLDDPRPEPEIGSSDKTLPLPGQSFKFNGHDAFVILPEKLALNPDTDTAADSALSTADQPIPWVWYAPTLQGLPSDAERWMFERLLKAGIAIAGIDVGESYGNTPGRDVYEQFYDHLVRSRGFAVRPCLLARSRGGLMLYSWAVQNPHAVAGIAGIYPVCNLASYPGIEKAAKAYQLKPHELEFYLANVNPVDRLAPLAAARVPIFHLHGDQDAVVPLEANSALLAERYRSLGGPIELQIVPGQGHNMWPGWFQSQPLVDFVIDCCR